MSDCQRDTENASVVIRAREHTDVWGQMQVLECRECGRRWSQ